MKQKLPLIILFLRILLTATAGYSQSTPYCASGGIGGFTITPPVGCVGEAVHLTSTLPSTATSVRYAYQFDKKQVNRPDPKDETDKLDYVYQTPGLFTIVQYGSNGSGFVLCKDYTVKETRELQGAVLTTCGYGSVHLTVPNDAIAKAFDKIRIDWGDGTVEIETMTPGKDLVVSHQYSSGSIPSVKIAGAYNDNACQNVLKTSVITTTTPPASLAAIKILSIEMQTDGTAKVIYEGMEGIATKVMIDDGGGTFVNTQKGTTSAGVQSVMIPNLNPQAVYKFKLVSLDICGTPVESNVVSSVVVEPGTTAMDEINSLTWKPYSNPADLIEYQLVRDGVVIGNTTDLSYLDKSVKCGKVYSYQLAAIVQGGIRSYSAPVEIEPKTAIPDIISEASVTVAADNLIESSVVLGGNGLTGTYDLVIERSTAGSGGWSRVSPPNNQSLTYQDKDVNTGENEYCYRFSYTNACKLSSPDFSPPVCSILLRANLDGVEWTQESAFTSGISSYDILEKDASGAIISQEPKGLQFNHLVDITGGDIRQYQVKAFASSGTLVSYSNLIKFVRDAIVLAPSAFTPNGDNINELFEVKSYFTTSFKLSIFNRWGNLLFYSNDSAMGWDGNNDKGIPAPEGYYVYKVEVKDIKGQNISQNGGFLLIR